MSYETILAEQRGAIGIVTLNRPKALNALSTRMMTEITEVLAEYDADPSVRTLLLTGTDKAFAAGADIKEMAEKSYMDVYKEDFISVEWDRLARLRKPLIGAIAGYALGGGCELAMNCDILIAAENAKFGQPEITLGVIPGAGGTQRLTRAVGKATAMDMVLTGRMLDAKEALAAGLVSRVVPVDDLLDEAVKLAQRIGQMSLPVAMMAKECVNRVFETGLEEGIRFERRLFHSCFATEDQKEGMQAFTEKRQPDFKDR
jgi:enoyl-CoA hydratase